MAKLAKRAWLLGEEFGKEIEDLFSKRAMSSYCGYSVAYELEYSYYVRDVIYELAYSPYDIFLSYELAYSSCVLHMAYELVHSFYAICLPHRTLF